MAPLRCVAIVTAVIYVAIGIQDIQAQSPCPEEFYDLSDLGVNMCLFHTVLQMDWFYAQDLCHSMGADLVSALTMEEMRAIVYFMQAPPFQQDYHRREVALYWPHWLSMNNIGIDDEWKWYIEGETLPVAGHITYWDFDEPSGTEVCARFSAGMMAFENDWHRWQVSSCYTNRPFVCSIRY